MKINFVHICENAIVSSTGKISIIEIFDRVITSTLPFTLQKFSIVLNITGRIIQPTKVIIESPNGTDISSVELLDDNLQPDKQTNNLIINFVNVPFSESGDHKIFLKENGVVIDPNRNDILNVILNN